jgi:5-methylcytosine-specific restriction endonuclease McrA
VRCKELGSEKSVTDARPRLRALSRTTPPLPQPCHRQRTLATAVPARSPRVSVRENCEGQGEGASPALDPIKLGRFPTEKVRDVRRDDALGDRTRDASAGVPLPSPRREAKADAERESSTGSVPGIHRPRARRNPAVLPDARGRNGRGSCPICGVLTDLTIDHILPRSLGGPDTPGNRRWLCRRCNSAKGGRVVSDDALRWYGCFERLSRYMGLGLKPPILGSTGPAPTLNRLLQFAVARTREGAS